MKYARNASRVFRGLCSRARYERPVKLYDITMYVFFCFFFFNNFKVIVANVYGKRAFSKTVLLDWRFSGRVRCCRSVTSKPLSVRIYRVYVSIIPKSFKSFMHRHDDLDTSPMT